ncbi:MAG: glutamine synthetase family protein [Alphaproteobacteria bacterium]|nr:glutamine synthetase family protein [Alphaproteobacteria bacterium]MBU0875870.1 glutamine synthetase family protein [Alphaproteobacteria bacterium]MBU1769950.1 glutamine synthetase family protein [Alphaproteobacteria bacterium]
MSLIERASKDLLPDQRCRILFADQLNLARGKYVPMSYAAKGRARICVGTFAVTYNKTMVPAPSGGVLEGLPDMDVVYDPDNLRSSWEANTRIALGELHYKGEPFPLCGRGALRRAVDAWRARGLEPMVGIELEAYVFQKNAAGNWVPYDTPGAFVYGTGPFSDPDGLIDEIWKVAESCGILIESINAEYDAPQFELTLRYADAIRAADDAFLFRLMAREILYRRGYLLSFLPKPFAEKSGSGMHFNLSFNDREGRNVFAGDVESGTLSQTMKGCIAGLLHHHEALAAIMAPTTNSYARLRPASLSGYWANWGIDHRAVTVRVSTETGQAARIEHRLADCAASPYFGLAAMLQAALLGLEHDYALPEAETSDSMVRAGTDRHTPNTLGDALDALEADPTLRSAVGAELVDNFLCIKREELRELEGKSGDEQIAYYLHYI